MYINGKKVTLEDLQAIAQKLIGRMIEDLYDDLVENGVESLKVEEEGDRSTLLNNMLEYFIQVEEYEKCSHIRDIINKQ